MQSWSGQLDEDDEGNDDDDDDDEDDEDDDGYVLSQLFSKAKAFNTYRWWMIDSVSQ